MRSIVEYLLKPNQMLIPAPFGAIAATLDNARECLLSLAYIDQSVVQNVAPQIVDDVDDSPLAKAVAQQVAAYFQDPTFVFDLPLLTQGTAFQQKVWAQIKQIPCGATLNYQTVGRLMACGSPRAVGGACGANPYPLIVPCHRVVGARGMGGFANHATGSFLNIKKWLLAHEGVRYP